MLKECKDVLWLKILKKVLICVFEIIYAVLLLFIDVMIQNL